MEVLMKINRRQFASTTASALAGSVVSSSCGAGKGTPAFEDNIKGEWQLVAPGIWKVRLGVPEKLTPVSLREVSIAEEGLRRSLPGAASPLPAVEIQGHSSQRGFVVSLPLEPDELVYGLGLQLLSFMQRGTKKTLRVNADPKVDLGDSHAPVPFYVTTRGYGVLVDTARYATFYCGGKARKMPVGKEESKRKSFLKLKRHTLPEAYTKNHCDEPSRMIIEIPAARGVDLYIFGGPSLLQAVQRYNLFSGGGCLPARWGLGFWYRCHLEFGQAQVAAMAAGLRNSQIPCDVLGLEPGWQTQAYPCSFLWSDKFKDPKSMIEKLAEQGYQLNLWEHAFTHPASPVYHDLHPLSGNYLGMGGITPDFLVPEARKIFASIHDQEHVSRGVSGYKLDECDNSDMVPQWSFPEVSQFPSGADGEQMHCFFGIKYQQAILEIFQKHNRRTCGLVRSSHALASPYPFVLYSDLYSHRDFIRGLTNCGFSGLLWCPEVRDAENAEDLIRRMQTVVFSPLAMVNAWYIKNPPWKQVRTEENNAGQFSPDAFRLENLCRELLRWRMRLIPYLHAAFVRYHREGVPPFRALVMDYPEDPNTWFLEDEYLAGDNLLVAPLTAGTRQRVFYLPEGEWFDFWTHQRMRGGKKYSLEVPLEQIPVYVRSGTLLALAEPTLHTGDPLSRQLRIHVYGRGNLTCQVYEEDGTSCDFSKGSWNQLELSWDAAAGKGVARRIGTAAVPPYQILEWKPIE
jgi:alpha-D-xyloside xylohydrolase